MFFTVDKLIRVNRKILGYYSTKHARIILINFNKCIDEIFRRKKVAKMIKVFHFFPAKFPLQWNFLEVLYKHVWKMLWDNTCFLREHKITCSSNDIIGIACKCKNYFDLKNEKASYPVLIDANPPFPFRCE